MIDVYLGGIYLKVRNKYIHVLNIKYEDIYKYWKEHPMSVF